MPSSIVGAAFHTLIKYLKCGISEEGRYIKPWPLYNIDMMRLKLACRYTTWNKFYMKHIFQIFPYDPWIKDTIRHQQYVLNENKSIS